MQTSGDEQAGEAGSAGFDRFYDLEFPVQVRRAFLLVGSNELANDIVQDAMVGVYRRWATLAHPGGYLSRSVLNGCRDAGRRRRRDHALQQRLGPTASTAEPGEVLGDVLRALPFNQRAAVVLRFYGAMTNDEIAEALGCSSGSVGPWIDRALNRMRKALQ